MTRGASPTYARPPDPPPDPPTTNFTFSPPSGPPPPPINDSLPNNVALNLIDNGEPLHTRRTSLRSLHLLPEELIVESVLSLLDAKDLVVLSHVSRLCYLFSRDDQLWRQICLEKWGHDGSVEGGLVFKGTWRLTYYFPGFVNEEQNDVYQKARLGVHSILAVQGFQSDYLYRKWCRCHMDLSHFVPGGSSQPDNTIEHVSGLNLTAETFQSRYESLSKPVIISGEGVIEAWPARQTWTLKGMLAKYGDVHFKVGNEYGRPRKVDMSFSSYIDYMHQQNDESPLYLFDHRFEEKAPAMLNEYKVPPIFEDDFLSALGDDRPDYRWLVIGPARSGASWHVDPLGTSAWNTLLLGRKRWALYPPHVLPPGVDPFDFSSASTLYWFLEVYPFLPPEMKPIEVIQNSGQTIVVPTGWWHAVLNLDVVNIAITQNWCSRWNLDRVVSEMVKAKSGKYQKMYSRFRDVITTQHPELSSVFSTFGCISDPRVLAEGYSTRAEFCDSFTMDSDKWVSRINQVWTTHFEEEEAVKASNVEPVSVGGLNPIYAHLPSKRLIKFYSHLGGGTASFASEVYALMRLNLTDTPSSVFCPQLIVHGTLTDADTTPWSWPYAVQSLVGTDESETVGEACIAFTVNDWNALVDRLACNLKRVHNAPLRGGPFCNLGVKAQCRSWPVYLWERIKQAKNTHAQWGHLQPPLLNTLNEYLRNVVDTITTPSGTICIFPIGRARLLHGDPSPGNIIGEWVTETESGERRWRPTHLVDFGDSFHADESADLDPLWDISLLYVTTLHCQQSMLYRLLDHYTSQTSWRNDWKYIRSRLCGYVMLWEFEAGIKGIKRCRDITGVGSWQEMEATIFGNG